MKARTIALFGMLVMLCGCVTTPQSSTTTTLENNVLPTEETEPATTLLECTLSLCDCKCHPKGTTIEETTGRLCGINCKGEYGVEGCELRDGSCAEVRDTTTTTLVQMANPASQKCVEDNGTLEILDRPDGQVGVCHLPGGGVCEEWAYFRGECAKGDCVCGAVGTRSEGWYCNGELLYWAQCSADSSSLLDCSRYAGADACTMEYDPACALVVLNTGQKIRQTYGNPCQACKAMKAVGYTKGECPAPVD